MNRRLFAALLFTALLGLPFAATVDAASVKIVRVWTEYRLAQDYLRIGDILTGRTFTGGSTEHRTQKDSGDGYFFTVRVDRSSDLRASDFTLRLSIIPPDGSATRTYTFPVPASKKRGLRLEIGVTGADWTFGEQQPLAWRIEVLDSNEAIVADEKSFLWEKPPG